MDLVLCVKNILPEQFYIQEVIFLAAAVITKQVTSKRLVKWISFEVEKDQSTM